MPTQADIKEALESARKALALLEKANEKFSKSETIQGILCEAVEDVESVVEELAELLEEISS